jgi:hypothetical protein
MVEVMNRPWASLAVIVTLGMIAPTAGVADEMAPWNEMATKYVDGQGLVNYGQWKIEASSKLNTFLTTMSGIKPDTLPTAAARMAFWVNVHNACAIRGVLDRYPTASVLAAPAFMASPDYSLAGSKLSLLQIANDKVLKLGDRNLLFALSFGAKGSPRLLNRAFTAADFPALLATLGQEFLADIYKNRVEPATSTAVLSELFHWHIADYENSVAGLVGFVKPLAPPALQAILARTELRIQFHFNATINSQ